MNDNLVTIIMTVSVAIIGSGSATAIVQHLLERAKTNPQRDGIRLLLQDKIEHLAVQALEAQEISHSQLKFLKASYKAYKSLKGNGDLEAIMTKVEKLPVNYHE